MWRSKCNISKTAFIVMHTVSAGGIALAGILSDAPKCLV